MQKNSYQSRHLVSSFSAEGSLDELIEDGEIICTQRIQKHERRPSSVRAVLVVADAIDPSISHV